MTSLFFTRASLETFRQKENGSRTSAKPGRWIRTTGCLCESLSEFFFRLFWRPNGTLLSYYYVITVFVLCLLSDGEEVAVVYFRNGYMPQNYTSEQVSSLCLKELTGC